MAREQADLVSKELAAQGGRADLGGKKIIALVAYLQRLGTDISKPADAAPAPTPAPAASGSGTTAKNPQPAPAGPVASKE
jgi:hypothetical protein